MTRPSECFPGFPQATKGYFPFPFFSGYAASYAQKHLPDYEVRLIDSITRNETYAKFYGHIVSLHPEWIVMETATSSWEHDQKLIPRIKEAAPGAKLILTGPFKYEEGIQAGAHAVIKGEYEKGCVSVIQGFASGIVDHMLLTSQEMNEAPIPMMDEEVWDRYWDSNPIGQIHPHLQIFASRGCPHKCVFCIWPAVMTGNDPEGTKARSVRFYSADYLEKYIRALLDKHPFRSIYFDDDTGNLNDKHTLEICRVMRKIGLPWSMMCRADTSSREVWKEMKDSGCFGVKVGFESGSQYVIDHIINKKLDLKEAVETCRYLKSIGMTVHGTFTYGLPGETDEQRLETFQFIKRLRSEGLIDSHQESGTATIDGTPLSLIAEGKFLPKYDGATNKDFERTPDGLKKREGMTV